MGKKSTEDDTDKELKAVTMDAVKEGQVPTSRIKGSTIAASAAVLSLITALAQNIRDIAVLTDTTENTHHNAQENKADKEPTEREKFMEVSIQHDKIINAVKELSKPTTVRSKEGDLITYSVTLNIKGEKHRISILEWVCAIESQCPGRFKSPRDPFKKIEPIPLFRRRIRMENLSKKTEGTFSRTPHDASGLVLWMGANPNYHDTPYAFYRDPTFVPVQSPSNPHPLYKSKRDDLIKDKFDKMLSGLNPLIEAKRKKEMDAAKRKQTKIDEDAKNL